MLAKRVQSPTQGSVVTPLKDQGSEVVVADSSVHHEQQSENTSKV